jgi:hypothetical protein
MQFAGLLGGERERDSRRMVVGTPRRARLRRPRRSYSTPLPESQKLAGLVAFYNEKIDIYPDGELQERPVTKFS